MKRDSELRVTGLVSGFDTHFGSSESCTDGVSGRNRIALCKLKMGLKSNFVV